MKTTVKKTALAVTLLALGTAALAHTGVKNKDVMARMTVMSDIGEQMKLIGAMAKGRADFDAAAANDALVEIAAQAAQIAPMFETRADDPKSEALPVIWEDFARFAELASETEAVAERLAGTIGTKDDLAPVLGQLGGACKACHQDYRK
jgi:cytochrome c556